jgi:hypothetical protein
MRTTALSLALLSCALCALATPACSKEYVRGSQDPSIDNPAMSTGLDKDDVQRMLSENLNHLRTQPIMEQWRTSPKRPTVAVMAFQNTTSEHIDSQLAAILSEAETWLVDANVVDVISRERQAQLLAEVKGQQDTAFDPSQAARYGRMMGVKYVITGKVSASDERTKDERRVQYFFFMQVLEVETGRIVWQRKSYATKMAR